LLELTSRCLEKSPEKRLTMAEVSQSLGHQSNISNDAMSHGDRIVREVNRAGSLSATGDSKQAISILLEILKENPWNLPARINAAEVYLSQGNVSEAIALAQKTLDAMPLLSGQEDNLYVVWLNLSFYLMAARKLEEAYKVTKKALNHFVDNWELLHQHAEVCRLTAADLLDESLQYVLDTDHAQEYKLLESNARLMLKEGVKCAEDALRTNPSDESLRVTYAGLLWLARDRKRLFPFLNQLMKDVGEHSVPAWLLFLKVQLDEKNFGYVEKQLQYLSGVPEFNGLLEGIKKELAVVKSIERKLARHEHDQKKT